MIFRRRTWSAAVLSIVASLVLVVASAQTTPEPPALRLDVGDGHTATWTIAQLKALPIETARAATRQGGTFEAHGVSVTTLLKLAGLDLSANLDSAPVVGRALIARAADGYVAVFGLAEVDPHFGHPPLMVVWATDDGAPLPDRRGPLSLVVTGDSRPGRWVRQLVTLEVRDLH